MTLLALIASVVLPVYSPKSASPLHVAAIDTNTMAVVRSWEFPAEYTGHRSACHLSGADSNMTFVAWTGGAKYNPATDPFGTSRGHDYPAVEVTETSPITPRFDVWAAGTALYSHTNAPAAGEADVLSEDKPVRVRVVRWKLDDAINYNMAFPARVVLDKMMDPRVATTLTEADFLGEDSHDIDWDYFSSEVANSAGVVYGNYQVVKAEYLVVLGDGPVGWQNSQDTNTFVTASTQVITRRFNSEQRGFYPLNVTCEPATNGSRGAISWDVWGSSSTNDFISPVAFSVVYKDGLDTSTRHGFLNDSLGSNITFNVYGTFRAPPQSKDGRWRWWPPSSFFVPGRICGIFMGDAKYRPDASFSGGSLSVGSYSTIFIFGGLQFPECRPIFCEIPE